MLENALASYTEVLALHVLVSVAASPCDITTLIVTDRTPASRLHCHLGLSQSWRHVSAPHLQPSQRGRQNGYAPVHVGGFLQ
jgi:hypothetical protein